MNATIVLAALASGLYVCNIEKQQKENMQHNKTHHRHKPTGTVPLVMENYSTPALLGLALLLSTSDYFRNAPFYLILYLVISNVSASSPPLNY